MKRPGSDPISLVNLGEQRNVRPERHRQDIDAVVDGLVEGLEDVGQGALPRGDVPADLVHHQASPGSAPADEPGGEGFEAGVGREGAGGDGGGVGPVADGVPGGEEVGGVGGVEGLVIVSEKAVDEPFCSDEFAVAG